MKPVVVAVLDVGKTNKKLSVYDRKFNVLGEARKTIETRMRDGLEVEASDELLAWLKESIATLAKDFNIRVISICVHGATCAVLDAEGKLAYPIISYTSAKGAEIQDEFYATYGDRVTLHHETCTPDVGFANAGKSLFYIKTRLPEVWDRCKAALFYDSYLGYELTGNASMEPTYLGNHNYLWDFFAQNWSSVATRMGADRLFPRKLSNPWDSLGVVKPELAHACGLSGGCMVTMGLHDSNANFLPYLAQGYENFILNSTGTWCVLMSQAEKAELSDAEIEAGVFNNLDAFNRPLRTAIFPGGMDYEKLGALTALADESNHDAIRKLISERSLFIIPGVMPGATAFPGVRSKVVHEGQTSFYADLEHQGGTPMTHLGQDYYAALNVSLALATRQLLLRCGAKSGTTVFIEGGFTKNRIYCELLASLCPEYTVALTSQKEGTAFGAALSGWMLADDVSLEEIGKDFTIDTSPIPAPDFGDLDAYRQAFEAQLTQG